MEFFNSAIDTLSTMISAIGGGLAIWGLINIGQSHGEQDPAAKNSGIKQLIGGGAVALVGLTLVPQLSGIFG